MYKQFGERRICSDYELKAPETHKLVRHYIYEQADVFGLKNQLERERFNVLVGHMPYRKYKDIFYADAVFTVLRNPFDRVVSEFKHFKRHNGYTKSLLDFVKERRNINVQYRFLQGLPLHSIGCIGISEDYDNSIRLLNATYGWKLPALALNSAPEMQSLETQDNGEAVSAFYELNKQDVLLYEEAKVNYTLRLSCLSRNVSYTCGSFSVDEKGVVRGVAFRPNSAMPIKVKLCIDGEEKESSLAKDYSAQARLSGYPRMGHVCFTFGYRVPPDLIDKATVEVVDSGQNLPKD
ncbi:hypothetical protein M5M_02720 [Simiduia agarivorans SA1 = DSM 21679]|uniref:Sulfotransferase family protein n=2 Tax=Simiduia TaxID=447467 RepID=K4KFP8_SIMAS|nr:hypothetical protein M5M_02720 [Simiduia agarivorans SA1 = DSM 21679]